MYIVNWPGSLFQGGRYSHAHIMELSHGVLYFDFFQPIGRQYLYILPFIFGSWYKYAKFVHNYAQTCAMQRCAKSHIFIYVIFFVSCFISAIIRNGIAKTLGTIFGNHLQLPLIEYTVWCNQMGTVFAEISSWTALKWYTVMKTEFKTKNMKTESFGIFITKILNFKSDWRICIFKEYST